MMLFIDISPLIQLLPSGTKTAIRGYLRYRAGIPKRVQSERHFIGCRQRLFVGDCLGLFREGGQRNCTRDAMISVRWRLPPLFFASNSRVAKTSLDVNLPSLLQILIAGLGQLPESNDLMPLDAFLLLSLLVGERLIRGD